LSPVNVVAENKDTEASMSLGQFPNSASIVCDIACAVKISHGLSNGSIRFPSMQPPKVKTDRIRLHDLPGCHITQTSRSRLEAKVLAYNLLDFAEVQWALAIGIEGDRALDAQPVDCGVESPAKKPHPQQLPPLDKLPEQFGSEAKVCGGYVLTPLTLHIEMLEFVVTAVGITAKTGSGVQQERDVVSQCQGAPSSVLEELVAKASAKANKQRGLMPADHDLRLPRYP
jgi:hypothetical protein